MRKRWTNEEILEALRALAERDGAVPTQRKVTDEPSLPTIRTIRRRFGTYNNAVQAAGLIGNPPSGNRNTASKKVEAGLKVSERWTREAALSALKRFYREHKRLPYERDHGGSSYLPTRSVYRRLFGNFNVAAMEAGLEPRNGKGSQPGREWRKAKPKRPGFEGWVYDKEKGKPAPIKEITRKGRRKNAV